MRHLKLELLGNRVLNLLDTRIAEFNEFSTLRTDQMIVLLTFICALKVCHIFTKLMLDNQTTIKQKFYRVVESCSAYLVVLVFHKNIEGLYIEMPFARIDLV